MPSLHPPDRQPNPAPPAGSTGSPFGDPRLTGAFLVLGFILCLILCSRAHGQPDGQKSRRNQEAHGPARDDFNLTIPDHPYDLILARPEGDSVVVSVLSYGDRIGFVSYGKRAGEEDSKSAVQALKKGIPVEWRLGSLEPDTLYHYRFVSRMSDAGDFVASPEYRFHTARPAGSTFTFTMSADAHLDSHTSPDVFRRTLANIRADQPDFHLDLGNLFMTDKHSTRSGANAHYVAQRYYLGLIGPECPVLLALGVHDGESARDNDGTRDCLSVWSNLTRKRYFPNPSPDAFYTGPALPDPYCGPLENSYAWTWGDALFVVLDPFRYSMDQGRGRGAGGRQRGADTGGDPGAAGGPAGIRGRDGWTWSLGLAQYRWLANTLKGSQARFKFVFIHNLLSGDQAARGGVEVAGFNEWGGRNADGSDGFEQHRPGWGEPIHTLLVRTHVTAVFKAHDNFYARQQLDGILYLMVPQPSFSGDSRVRDLEAYGYKSGTFLGNSGHVRVTVSPKHTVTEYVRSTPKATVADRFEVLSP